MPVNVISQKLTYVFFRIDTNKISLREEEWVDLSLDPSPPDRPGEPVTSPLVEPPHDLRPELLKRRRGR